MYITFVFVKHLTMMSHCGAHSHKSSALVTSSTGSAFTWLDQRPELRESSRRGRGWWIWTTRGRKRRNTQMLERGAQTHGRRALREMVETQSASLWESILVFSCWMSSSRSPCWRGGRAPLGDTSTCSVVLLDPHSLEIFHNGTCQKCLVTPA